MADAQNDRFGSAHCPKLAENRGDVEFDSMPMTLDGESGESEISYCVLRLRAVPTAGVASPDRIVVMGRSGCTICANEATREKVDALLVEGKGVRKIGAAVGIPKSTIYLHKIRCVVPAVSQAVEESGRNRGDGLLAKLDGLLREAMAVVRRAKTEKNDKTLLAALKEARDIIGTIGDFSGAKPEPPARLSYTIVFEGGRPVARKDTIELPAIPAVESLHTVDSRESGSGSPALKDAD